MVRCPEGPLDKVIRGQGRLVIANTYLNSLREDNVSLIACGG